MAALAETNSHSVTIEERNHLSMTGAVNVENFEESAMTIETTMGNLTLKGSDMHIIKFDTQAGELVIEGEFDQIEYSDSAGKKEGFFARLLG